MAVEISYLSYHTFSNKDITYIPNSLTLNQPNLDTIIKGSTCGGYNNIKCKTCNRLDPQCLGHWFKLECPGIRLYIKSYDYILTKLSEYVCFFHRGFICNIRSDLTKKEILYTKKNGICGVCGEKLIKFSCKKDDDSIKFVGSSDPREIFVDPIALYECIEQIPVHIQEMITDQRIPLQDMFYVDCIPITPTYLRISNKFDRVNEYAHYLTNKYMDMISILKDLHKPDLDPVHRRISTCRLQIKMNEIIDGKESVDPKFESCSGYLKTKYNLFREYINGKRNPKTARIVLNANALPSINYFYPCIQYINYITTSIMYCSYTKILIDSLITKGEVSAYYSNSKKTLCNTTAIHTLEFGDYVEVAFKYGDRLVINGRQPALHLTNICVSKALTPDRNFINCQSTQLPTAVLPGMNGDQDGDEVWSKEVQSVMSKYEQRFLMLPTCNLISPAHGGINYGIIQDELLSINALLGRSDISYYHTVLMLGKYMELLPSKDTKTTFSGREIISATIPTYLNKQGVIKDGIIQHSRLKSADVGVGGGTVHSITKSLMDLDPGRSRIFLESILNISKNFITLFPHGVRVKDIIEDMDEWNSLNQYKEVMYGQIENNRKSYLQAVTGKKIIPMDSDYSIKFIKLEVAKVVTEITRRSRKIIDRYIEQFKNGEDFNRLVLYILAEFKLDLATLSIIYCQANPSIEPKNKYLHRVFPTYPPTDKSLGNLGLVKSSLIHGLNLEEMITLADKARENVVTTVCQTASKGEIGRYIAKNLQDYTINFGFRFLVLANYLINPCVNVYKMSVRQMYLVNLDINLIKACRDTSDILDMTILDLYRQKAPYLFNNKTKKYETLVAYLTDIQMIFESFRGGEQLSSEVIVRDVDTFFDYIHTQYMFNFSTTTMLKLITLMFCKSCKVHKEGLEKLFNKIEYKYKIYPEDGAPIGVEAATSISEVETQSTLSAHLQFTKNGCDVKSGQSNTNINLMKINVNSTKSSSKIFNLMSQNLEALQRIKNGLEFVSLEDIMLSINYKQLDTTEVLVETIISRCNMKKLGIELETLFLMVENFLDATAFIQEGVIDSEIVEDTVVLSIKIKLSSLSKLPVLKLITKQGICKGVFSLYRYIIEPQLIMNQETFVDEEWWSMTCEIPNSVYLSYFDTTEIIINPSLEYSNRLGPMQAYNILSSLYVASGLMRFHTTLLAQHQTRCGESRRVEKNPFEGEMTTVGKIAFIKPLKDLQEAVKRKAFERCDDISSCVLLNKPIKQGTGVIDVSIDMGRYINDVDNVRCKVMDMII